MYSRTLSILTLRFVFLLFFLLPSIALPENASNRLPNAGKDEKRVALIIGNSAYPTSALDNPKNDATAMAASLRRLGFDVELKVNATKTDFDAAQKRFHAKANKADVAAFFYAGHGIQYDNQNFLVPIDAKPQSAQDFKRELVKLEDVIDDMGQAKVRLVFFDACRDNPLSRSFSRGSSRGMAAPNEATGTLISFATKHGNTAADGSGKHSPYTEALLSALENPTEEIHALLRKKVQLDVKEKTRGQQEPWTYGNLNGDFYFIKGPVNITVTPATIGAKPDPSAIELELWRGAQEIKSIEAYEDYLGKYPEGQFSGLAKAAIAKLKARSKSEQAHVTESTAQDEKLVHRPQAPSKRDTSKMSVQEESPAQPAPALQVKDDGQPFAHAARSAYKPSDNIEVVFKNLPKSQYCWIDISRAEDPNTKFLQYQWTYGKPDGTMVFSRLNLTPGLYEVRVHFNRGYNIDYKAQFRVM